MSSLTPKRKIYGFDSFKHVDFVLVEVRRLNDNQLQMTFEGMNNSSSNFASEEAEFYIVQHST